VTDFAIAVYFKGEHAGCLREIVGVLHWNAEVVCFRCGLGCPDIFCQIVVSGLPLRVESELDRWKVRRNGL
jgi:hypothetical protein